MPHFAIVDDQTGEFHVDCPECGIAGYGDREDVENVSLPANHSIKEISEPERRELGNMYYEVVRNGKKVRVDDYYDLSEEELKMAQLRHKNRVDLKKATKYLKDRGTVNLFGVNYQESLPVKVLSKL